MRIKRIATIQSGYISRGKIEPRDDGTCFLLQAKDVDGDQLAYATDGLVRFLPAISNKDWFLKPGDILFMARGANNFSVLMKDLPDNVLAAACFFIVRVSGTDVYPEYLTWYLNQAPVEEYLKRFSGRGVHMPVVRRAVLEGIDVPLPSLETQKKISDINFLLKKEEQLYREIAEKRKRLVTDACLMAVEKSE